MNIRSKECVPSFDIQRFPAVNEEIFGVMLWTIPCSVVTKYVVFNSSLFLSFAMNLYASFYISIQLFFCQNKLKNNKFQPNVQILIYFNGESLYKKFTLNFFFQDLR